MGLYEIRPKRTGDGVELTGRVGSNGALWYKCVRDAALYARWHAGQVGGGILRVYDSEGRLRGERTMEGGGTRNLFA